MIRAVAGVVIIVVVVVISMAYGAITAIAKEQWPDW